MKIETVFKKHKEKKTKRIVYLVDCGVARYGFDPRYDEFRKYDEQWALENFENHVFLDLYDAINCAKKYSFKDDRNYGVVSRFNFPMTDFEYGALLNKQDNEELANLIYEKINIKNVVFSVRNFSGKYGKNIRYDFLEKAGLILYKK